MSDSSSNSRRDFLKQSAAAGVALAASTSWAASAPLRVGLIGCGGRGTGAAKQALSADPNTTLVAMGDVFPDRLKSSLANLTSSGVGDRVKVDPDMQFVGFDAYKKVIDNVDVVLLTSPPHFRPNHLPYAVAQGKHCFVEKPVATDAVGLRKITDACREAKKKNLAIVSGLCWRYHDPRRQTMQRVLDGKIGDIVSIETTYNAGGVWEPRKKRSEVDSDMEAQLANWYYHTWISGDHIVEQAVHGLDSMAWAMGDEPPVKCWGVGGRQARTDPRYGNIWDHFSIVYEYANGTKGYHMCRHWPGAPTHVKDYVNGSKGVCDVFGNSISGKNEWKYDGPKCDMYQTEHDELFASIRSGEPINNGEYMVNSTMLAIIGRMAAYTGEILTWDQAMNSKLDLSPPSYDWIDLPAQEIPVPGKTKFI